VKVFKSIAPAEFTVTELVPNAPFVTEPVEEIPACATPLEIVVPPV